MAAKNENIYTRIHLHDGKTLDFYFGADVSIRYAAFLMPELLKKRLGNRWRRYVATEVKEITPTKKERVEK
ncbi:hypothetical protein [Paenibacillus sp. KN14-4R]|uniref:hypothetical protein n=1 Tax=Paenibacillus sp. KN14-4R TaxID=3445773 RepID=UPI003FA01B50